MVNFSLPATDLTSSMVEEFFDALLTKQIEEAKVAGVVVSVVNEGKVLFTKGYGYADVQNKVPVSSEETLFRPGSISKLFTATAVMQLVEQGKLDLDRDINDYLDFRIPSAFDKPITLRNLMTHRAGFEETIKDLFVSKDEELHPLSHYLKTHRPQQIHLPGEIPAYSNYGMVLAGYIVERISGQTYYDYMEEHLLNPLEMHHSTFRQPLQSNLASMSKGYITSLNAPKPFELIQGSPAGALSTTAKDMAQFMIMHLQKGRYKSSQILNEKTANLMHTRQEGWPQAMNAMCIGFYEQSQNGYRIIGHEGHTILFHSNLFLNLDAGTGVFISYNSAGTSPLDLSALMFNQFMDRFYPDRSSPLQTTPLSHAQKVSGIYKPTRRSDTTLLSIVTLFLEKEIVAHSDNTISISGIKDIHDQTLKFKEREPMVFHQVDGKGRVAFLHKDESQLAFINYDTNYPSGIFHKISSPFEKRSYHIIFLGCCLSVLGLTLLMWLFSKQKTNITQLTSLCMIVYLVGVIAFVFSISDISMLSDKRDWKFRALQVIGWMGGIGSLLAIYMHIKGWFDRERKIHYKIWNFLQALACVGFFWFIAYWNLLNFDLSY